MDGKMNKDVKIGLSIGLLALIAIFCLVVLPKGQHKTEPKPDTTVTEGEGGTPTAGQGAPEQLPLPGETVSLDSNGADTQATATMSGHPDEPDGTVIAEGFHAGDPGASGPVRPGMDRIPAPGTGAGVGAGMLPGTGAAIVPTKTYIVKSGDTLSSIAKSQYGSTRYWTKIKEANHITNEKGLKLGQPLVIPPLTESTGAATAPTGTTGVGTTATGPTMTTGTGGRTYTVAQGDTPGAISKKMYGTTQRYQLIMDANGIKDTGSLRVGAVLNIPELPTTTTTTPTTVTTGGITAVAPTGTDNGTITHIVAQGETLGDISKKYYGTTQQYKRIMEANHITDPTKVATGRRLVIPAMTTATGAATSSAISPTGTTTSTTYTGVVETPTGTTAPAVSGGADSPVRAETRSVH